MAYRRFDATTLPAHRERIRALTEGAQPRWGGLRAIGMVCHLRATFEASLGEIEVGRFTHPVLGLPVGLIVFYVVGRIPPGKPGTTPPIPALCPASGASFEEERERLVAVMERFVERASADPRALPSPRHGLHDDEPVGARARSTHDPPRTSVRTSLA